MKRGDCLSCQTLGVCSLTSYERVRDSFTCDFFHGASEPEYVARLEAIARFGEPLAIQAMLKQSQDEE